MISQPFAVFLLLFGGVTTTCGIAISVYALTILLKYYSDF